MIKSYCIQYKLSDLKIRYRARWKGITIPSALIIPLNPKRYEIISVKDNRGIEFTTFDMDDNYIIPYNKLMGDIECLSVAYMER